MLRKEKDAKRGEERAVTLAEHESTLSLCTTEKQRERERGTLANRIKKNFRQEWKEGEKGLMLPDTLPPNEPCTPDRARQQTRR